MGKYLLHGSLKAKPGKREELADILLEASKRVSTIKGCKLYVVGVDDKDAQAVYVTEIWDSKADHDLSLKEEGVRTLIMKAMPLLDGQPEKGQEIDILGGA